MLNAQSTYCIFIRRSMPCSSLDWYAKCPLIDEESKLGLTSKCKFPTPEKYGENLKYNKQIN